MTIRNGLMAWGTAAAMVMGNTAMAGAADTKTAVFAGGCFWCVESDFDHVDGVLATISGYTGGTLENPTYKDVTKGGTGHYEAVEITYDPAKVTYDELMVAFWHSVDPTDAGGQFCDRGDSYRTAVFVTPEQREVAEASKAAVAGEISAPIVTEILDVATFYPAEDYHQDYYTKNPVRYNFYRLSCGRNQRVDDVWGANSYLGIKH
ncbi:peptide-methionine (S)-S-oxide reductase MsrA [Mariluticola halotolerans]|uniref:peptide-methionine (S)-S-oxide reductase MsrA n=1 Tax=Mariluticola halotolerans TaxID=2909283 RepID=UPI0034A0B339